MLHKVSIDLRLVAALLLVLLLVITLATVFAQDTLSLLISQSLTSLKAPFGNTASPSLIQADTQTSITSLGALPAAATMNTNGIRGCRYPIHQHRLYCRSLRWNYR